MSQGFAAPQEIHAHPFKDRESSNRRGPEAILYLLTSVSGFELFGRRGALECVEVSSACPVKFDGVFLDLWTCTEFHSVTVMQKITLVTVHC